jgi:hypothetical protein
MGYVTERPKTLIGEPIIVALFLGLGQPYAADNVGLFTRRY